MAGLAAIPLASVCRGAAGELPFSPTPNAAGGFAALVDAAAGEEEPGGRWGYGRRPREEFAWLQESGVYR